MAFLQEQNATLLRLVESRLAPAPSAPTLALVPAEPPKPLLEKVVEQAIAARAVDPAAERLSRQFALQMAARGVPANEIAAAVRRGSVPRETIDEELRQVVA